MQTPGELGNVAPTQPGEPMFTQQIRGLWGPAGRSPRVTSNRKERKAVRGGEEGEGRKCLTG